jgi:hypothetical protein
MTQFIKLTCLSLSAPSNFCFVYQSRLEAYPGRHHNTQYNDTQHSNKNDSQAESHHLDNQHNSMALATPLTVKTLATKVKGFLN